MILSLPNLKACLEQTNWRQLKAIMACHGIPIANNQRKSDIIELLHNHLTSIEVIKSIIAQFDGNEQSALRALVQAEGKAIDHAFERSHGITRAYRPWDKKEAQGEQPWLNPISATEALWWRGLIYLTPPKPTSGELQYWTLPLEIHNELDYLFHPKQETATGEMLARPGQPPDLLFHLAIWHATVASDPTRPLHGRWLLPKTVATLYRRIGLGGPNTIPSRSERNHPYLAFLHSLAQAGQFVHLTQEYKDQLSTTNHQLPATNDQQPITNNQQPTTNNQQRPLLSLTPRGWQWLELPTDQRWQQLWQLWVNTSYGLASPYHFAWEPLDEDDRQLVVQLLTKLSVQNWLPLEEAIQQLRLLDRWDSLPPPQLYDWNDEESLYDPLVELFKKPLFWLGVVELSDITPNHAAQETLLVRLSPRGAWLLEKPNASAPVMPAPESCTLQRGAPNIFQVPLHIQPAHLVRLARYAQWVADDEEIAARPTAAKYVHALQLDPMRIGQAGSSGIREEELFQDLALALGRGLSRREQQRWRKWLQAGQQIAIRPALLLETSDPELMGKIRKKQLVRRRLGAPLGPARNEINPQDVLPLVQTLETMGYPVHPPPEAHPELLDPGEEPKDLSPGAQYLFLQIYEGLGHIADLPVKIDWELKNHLRGRLSPMQAAAAQEAAQQVLDAVDQSLYGYQQIPSYATEIVEPEESYGVIYKKLEEAIAQETQLELTYLGPGYDEPMKRLVTPYWLEERYGLNYLVAYCHRRSDERVFRVDRIVSIG